jgi:hypothetical protein
MDEIPNEVLEQQRANLAKVSNAPDGQAFDYLCRAAAAFLTDIVNAELAQRAKRG